MESRWKPQIGRGRGVAEHILEHVLTWSGHSTFLYQNTNLNIIIDPHLTSRASPFSYLGPKRFIPSLLNENNLPNVDVVAVSHNHYDHLDIKSLKLIYKKFPNALFLVPLGDKELLKKNGIDNVKEFDWWESIMVNETKISFTPVQHWSKEHYLIGINLYGVVGG